jgi:hypothetical protein
MAKLSTTRATPILVVGLIVLLACPGRAQSGDNSSAGPLLVSPRRCRRQREPSLVIAARRLLVLEAAMLIT